jgi:phosphatidylinositol glycan class B
MKFIYIFAIRLLNGLILRSYYSPDEYWQSQEVAHHDTFGYGYLTQEWTHADPQRGGLYTLIFTICFSILKYLHLDSPTAVAYSPRVVQAIFASLFDFYLLKLAHFIGGEKLERIAEYVNYLSWFSLYAIPRTLLNSIEATLLTAALYYEFSAPRSYKARAIVAINFAIRPTSIIPWAIIWPMRLILEEPKHNILRYILTNIATGVAMITISVVADYIYYQRLTSTALNFMLFNFLSSGADVYGVHDRLWYFTGGLPLVLAGWFLLLLLGVYQFFFQNTGASNLILKRLTTVLLFAIAVLSQIKHKEDRFLLPYLGILIILIARVCQNSHDAK